MEVGGGAGGGVEWRGAPARCAGELDRGGGGSEWWRSQDKLRHTQKKGARGARVKP
jgi:hypothetical protein